MTGAIWTVALAAQLNANLQLTVFDQHPPASLVALDTHGASDVLRPETDPGEKTSLRPKETFSHHHWWDHVDKGLLCFRGVLATFLLCVMVSSMLAYQETKGAKSGKHDAEDGPPDRGIGGSEARASLMALVKEWLNDADSWKRAWALTGGAVVFWIVREASWAYILSANHAEVTNSLTSLHESGDMSRVYTALLVMLLWDLFWSVPLFHVMNPLFTTTFTLDLRAFLTGRAMKAYLNGGGHAYYFIKVQEGKNGIDNPDQRIAEDVDRISEFSYSLYASVLSAFFGCAMWTHVVFDLASSYVVFVCLGSCVLRTGIAWFGFINSLVLSRRKVLHTGADLRYGLTRVRDSAEEIALGDGEEREHTTAVGLFQRQIQAVWCNKLVHVRYGVSVGILDHFPTLVLWLLMMHDIAEGRLGIGDALRVHFAYDQIGKVLGFVIENFNQFTDLQADADRLHQLLQACDGPNNAAAAGAAAAAAQIDLVHEDADALKLTDVHVVAPDCPAGQTLGGLTMTVPDGKALLVMGPSGVGKTALLRAVAGLWRTGTGTIGRPGGPAKDFIKFLPNRCYLPMGTLLDLVTYPDTDGDAEMAAAALRRAKLGHVLTEWGLHLKRDWKPLLSPGEQQRVGFARLFMHLVKAKANSCLAVLDESTGALDVPTERLLYAELRKELRGGGLRGILSVGHRIDLRDYHDVLLTIGDETLPTAPAQTGTWCAPGKTLPWNLYTEMLDLPPPAR